MIANSSSGHDARDSPTPAQQAGEALLEVLSRAARKPLTVPRRAKFDAFLARNKHKLVAALSSWILADSLKQSQAAIPDGILVGDRMALRAWLMPMVGNYWSMHALVRRERELGLQDQRVVKDLKRLSLQLPRLQEERAAVEALVGRPRWWWRVPIYSRAGPLDTKTPKGRATLERRIRVALLREPARAVPSLHREVGGTKAQVRAALKRLTRAGQVWAHRLEGHPTSEEALQQDLTLYDVTDEKSELEPEEYDRRIGGVLQDSNGLTVEQLRELVGGSVLDVRAGLDRQDVLHVFRGHNTYWSLRGETPPKQSTQEFAAKVRAVEDETLAAPWLQAIRRALGGDFRRTMAVQRVLESSVPDGWRSHLAKEREVMRVLYEVLDNDEETMRQVFAIVKEESDV